MSYSRLTWTALAAAAGVLSFADAATAQSYRRTYIPPDAKGFRIQQLLLKPTPAPVARTPAPAPVAVTSDPLPLQVAITIPQPPPSETIAIRGPDGQVRRFEVEGGREALESRVIVIRPGERATISFVIRR